MLRAVLLASVLVVGCGNKSAEQKKVPAPAASVLGADGLRHIPIVAGPDGYAPETIKGKPGEKLVLVFTRTVEGDCLASVKLPDGKVVPLPMNTATDVAITVPQTGKVEFACAMDMFKGVIVADPS